jgi:putative membrane protein
VKTFAISNVFETRSSQFAALTKQLDADTKPFAEKVVSDHRKTSIESKALVDSGRVKAALPAGLDSEHQTILDELKAKDGKNFGRHYDQIQLLTRDRSHGYIRFLRDEGRRTSVHAADSRVRNARAREIANRHALFVTFSSPKALHVGCARGDH